MNPLKGTPPAQAAATIRRLVPGAVVLIVIAAMFGLARLPAASAATRASLAARFHFTELPIALPAGLPQKTTRQVNPAYAPIRAWISSVGAGVAVGDFEGTGVANDLCLVDPRSDSVIVTPAPGTGNRFAPFVLDAAPLPMNSTAAPMGCAPGDFNGDGRMDLLVYYWGRTPIIFLARPGATSLSPAAYVPTELVPQQVVPDGAYHGPLWNTNAVSIADFDGDGHPDIGVFNYFRDSQVLDPAGQPNVSMNHSMSRAQNAGGAHIMRWVSATTDGRPTVHYEEQADAIDPALATGWTLAAGSADIDGDLRPELYIANDFGNDHLFHNVSTPGHIRFQLAQGQRGATTPKSMVLGHDSFKGMSIDFGDLANNGKLDMFVSNITSSWGLEESNFVWMNNATSGADARAKLDKGIAPFDNKASALNMAWTGWGWDAKMADFDNSGNLSIVQADGFIKGTVNRWSWLQELAMTNDELLDNPAMWPKAGVGDDIAGSQHLAFWVKEPSGRFANMSHELGLDVPLPTRGIAVADTTGTGSQDFAVARQWAAPAFYHNDHPANGAFLGLRLYRPAAPATKGPKDLMGIGSPAYGAVARITTASGHTQLAQLDGGGGHSGKRSFDVFFGLGHESNSAATVELRWRDLAGAVHAQTLHLPPGWHDLMLDSAAQEVVRS
jgi:hypothetical protein